MMEWLDISTAPKDGTKVLVCGDVAWEHGWDEEQAGLAPPVGQAVAWLVDGDWTRNENLRYGACGNLTHWKPLGPLPECG